MSEPSVFIPFICGTCLSRVHLVSARSWRTETSLVERCIELVEMMQTADGLDLNGNSPLYSTIGSRIET